MAAAEDAHVGMGLAEATCVLAESLAPQFPQGRIGSLVRGTRPTTGELWTVDIVAGSQLVQGHESGRAAFRTTVMLRS